MKNNDKNRKIIFKVREDYHEGIENYLLQHLKTYSLKQIRRWINDKVIYLNGRKTDNKTILKKGDVIEIRISQNSLKEPQPENIPLKIIFEDNDIIVLDKPSDIAVHPAPGTPNHTIVNALLFHTKELSNLNGSQFPGIVHRLDKNTSGLMMVAKNNKTHKIISEQIAKRLIKRIYYAIVWGVPENSKGIIEAPIGISKIHGIRYAISHSRGKPAKTQYEVVEIYKYFSLLKLSLLTGRTHQIRLHLAYIGHPVLGDNEYCRIEPKKKLKNIQNLNPDYQKIILSVNRQMLHAAELSFNHPITRKPLRFSSPPPHDFDKIMGILRKAFN